MKKNNFWWYYLLIVGLIIFVFFMIYSFNVINPTSTDWIFASGGDISQHYVGWEAYRVGNWMFPIGLTNMVSYPSSISVIYTDSIPLMALFFKLISFILPKTFQYLGLYGLLCFVLQGILSVRIIKKYTDSLWHIIVVSLLFVLVPSMIFRMFYHTALASQWLLLLSLESIFLYDDFNKKNKIYYFWGIMGFLVVTIHLYYLVMCGIILIGYIVLDVLKTKKVKKSIVLLLIYIGVAFLSIWIFGGFTNMGYGDNDGFGLFSYNLNGLVNSQGVSEFLREMPMLDQQYEGFSYLGFGVIILIIIAFVTSVKWFVHDRKDLLSYKYLVISLLLISIISLFVALSPKAYVGNNLIYDLKLPDFILNLWGTFRSTGRFIWPVVYILTLLSIIIIIKRLSFKKSLIILSLCTCIQLKDIQSYLGSLNSFYNQKIPLKEDSNISNYVLLNNISVNKKINVLVLVSKDFYDDDLIMYADWAINHNMKINRFYFARKSFDKKLLSNTKKFLDKKSDNVVFLFTTKRECLLYELNCYKLENNYSIGYVKELV